MRKLVDRWTFSTVFFLIVIKAMQGIKAIFPPKEDGWRKAARAYYKSEESKFVLGLFYLKPRPDSAGEDDLAVWTKVVALNVQQFFSTQSAARVQLCYDWDAVYLRAKESCDCAIVDFLPDGSMRSIEMIFDPQYPPPAWMRGDGEQRLLRAMLLSYNATQQESDVVRPRRLKQSMSRCIRSDFSLRTHKREAMDLAQRMLSAIVVSSSALSADAALSARFEHPDFLNKKHPGLGAFHVHLRKVDGLNEADLFLQCSHIAIDGKPAAKLLQELKQQWGVSRPPVYPAAGFCTGLTRSTSPRSKPLYHLQMYVDSASVLKVRKALLQRYGKELCDIPLISLLGWALSMDEAIQPHKIMFPVEFNVNEIGETSLSFLALRPFAYRDLSAFDCGFLRFQQEFNEKLALTKGRRSVYHAFLQTVAIVHPTLYYFPIRFIPAAFAVFIGSLCLTMLKNTEYVVAPTCEMYKDGGIAIGNLKLPSIDGRTVGIVSIKGTMEQVVALKSIVQHTFAGIENLISRSFT